MVKPLLPFFALLAVFVLISCQSGGKRLPECVDGFEKIEGRCRPTGRIGNNGIFASHMKKQTGNSPQDPSVKNQAVAQQLHEAAVRMQQQRTEQEVQAHAERAKAPVQNLQQKTVPESAAKSALRNELRDSFKNEYRSKLSKASP